jgi:flavin-dependent dehydrogenase
MPMKEIVCKLLVIGAGPGGYICAIRAGQLGVDTVIVEASGSASRRPNSTLPRQSGGKTASSAD